MAIFIIASARPAGAQKPDSAQTLPPGQLVREGNALFGEEAFEQALSRYAQAADALPGSAEIEFNRGLTALKLGQLDQATQSLNRALLSEDVNVEAAAKFLLGNARHRQAVESKEQDPQASIEALQQATQYYLDGLQLKPDEQRIRGDVELAQNLIELIREQQQRQEDQQQQPNDQDKSGEEELQQENEQNSEQQNQEQEQQSQQSDEEDNQEQGSQEQQSDESQEGEEQEQKDQEGRQNEQQQQQEQQRQESGEQGDREQQQSQADAQGEQEQEAQQISEEQAERMFQQIRDKERQRRLEKARRDRQNRRPVKRDW